MSNAHILLVDDEESIRATLPLILERHGFEVTAVGSLAEAMAAIKDQKFDIVLADINIGEGGGGFSLVHATRQLQPDALNIIFSGYPEFASALEAIRAKVDDFVVKPVEIPDLLARLTQRIAERRQRASWKARKRISEVLRENVDAIIQQWLQKVENNKELTTIALSRSERTDHLPDLLSELAASLKGPSAKALKKEMQAAVLHGQTRYRQGYSIPMVVEETRILLQSTFSVIQSNLLALDLTFLIPDMVKISDSLQAQLKVSLAAYVRAGGMQQKARSNFA